MGAPPSPRPTVVKGDDAEGWLTGVLGGVMGFLMKTNTQTIREDVTFTQTWLKLQTELVISLFGRARRVPLGTTGPVSPAGSVWHRPLHLLHHVSPSGDQLGVRQDGHPLRQGCRALARDLQALSRARRHICVDAALHGEGFTHNPRR